jgi:hypothetical protein
MMSWSERVCVAVVITIASAAAGRAAIAPTGRQPVLGVPGGFTVERVAAPPLVERPDDGRAR